MVFVELGHHRINHSVDLAFAGVQVHFAILYGVVVDVSDVHVDIAFALAVNVDAAVFNLLSDHVFKGIILLDIFIVQLFINLLVLNLGFFDI